MNLIKHSKIRLVLKQFENQLKADSQIELERQKEEIRKENERKIMEITKQKENYIIQANELRHKLRQNIDFFNMVLADLETKSKDMETSCNESIEYIKKEKKEAEINCARAIEKLIGDKLNTHKYYYSNK